MYRGNRSICSEKLRIIDENSDFIEREEEQGNITIFNDDKKLETERNESTSATDASTKDGILVGVQKIEDDYECVSMRGRSWSMNWNKNSVLASKSAMLLDLVEVAEIIMRVHDEGKIMTHAD